MSEPPESTGGGSVGVHLLLLASIAIWGSTFVAMKAAVAHVSWFELVGLRFGIGLPVLCTLLWLKRIPLAFERSDIRPLVIASAVLVVHFLLQPKALSLRGSSATNAGWIIAFSPIWIALLSRLLLGERLSANQIVGIVLAMAGVIALVSKGNLGSLAWLESKGDWLIFVTSFTWALATISTRDLSRRRSPLAVTLIVFLPVCAVGLAMMAARSDFARLARLPVEAPEAFWAVLFLGILGTIAQWFWQLGVARIGAARAGIYLYLQPLVTTALGVRLLDEDFGAVAAAGGLILLFGVWWAGRGPKKQTGIGVAREAGRISEQVEA